MSLQCMFLVYSSTEKGISAIIHSLENTHVTMDVACVEHQPYFGNMYLQGRIVIVRTISYFITMGMRVVI